MQSAAYDADINTIMKRFGITGEAPAPAHNRPGEFGDFSAALDFHTAMNRVTEAQQAFARLPAALRARFQNDPGQFLDYVNNSDNIEEAVDLGILSRQALEAVKAAEAVAAPVVAESTSTNGEGTPAP